jgi:hypothetical protein
MGLLCRIFGSLTPADCNFSISSGRQALPNSITHHMIMKDLVQA